MGIEYSIACKKCKVVRDLDKFYTSSESVETRQDAEHLATKLEKDSFRVALLVSFMHKHNGHDCIFFWENTLEAELISEDPDYKEDFDFWDININESKIT